MRVLPLLALLSLAATTFSAGGEILGTQPPEWTVQEWLGAEPMTLAGLRGKVVVVRWWTGPGCPYCAGTVRVLNDLWKTERAHGVVVIGMYHHKSRDPLTRAHVSAQMQRLGIGFPVAIDAGRKTLHRWWLDGREQAWTSVTFVLDRRGVVRHIHPGGEITAGSPEAAALRRAVEAAL